MRELRLVLLGLAAVIALLLGGTFLLRAVKGPPPQQVATVPDETETAPAPTSGSVSAPTSSPTQGSQAPLAPAALKEVRASIERALAESPDYVRFFDRLRLVFPSEYDTIMDGLAAANAQKKDINPDVVMTNAITALRRTRGALAANASDAALGQIFAMQLTEMRELEKRDPHLCVAFLYGANGIGFLSFATDHRALVADAAIAGLDAMNSGRMDRVQRGAPSDSDFQALDKSLVDKGLSRPEIEALLDGKTPDPPIADDRMCKAGETYLETLAALPADARARLYGLAVDLMAKT